MAKAQKKRASRLEYVSQKQMVIPGFEMPFDQHLSPDNRWVKLSQAIPWDKMTNIYLHKVSKSKYGASKINPRMVLGALIIKHYMDYTDRETIESITENVYMQYFVGLSSFSSEPIFDASLFVTIRERLDDKVLNEINEIVVKHWNEQVSNITQINQSKKQDAEGNNDEIDNNDQRAEEQRTDVAEEQKITAQQLENEGTLIIDATACPQAIAYPTDLKILNESREWLEAMIDSFHACEVNHNPEKKIVKPRTYRDNARQDYLRVAQAKSPGVNKIRKGIKQQLSYIKRNLGYIDKYLQRLQMGDALTSKQQNYLLRIDLINAQQQQMYAEKSHRVEDRIVNLHQPYVRPIVRGKTPNKVEFGAKIQIALTGTGMCFLDHMSWDAFNEGQYLTDSVEKYKQRHGYYPQELLADKIYCTRANRAWLKEKGIKLKAKPLGRPSALSNQVSPGERNPIEGKIGQAKLAYGLNRIKAKLSSTSKSWIASIVLVLNLVKLAGMSAYCLVLSMILAAFDQVPVEKHRLSGAC